MPHSCSTASNPRSRPSRQTGGEHQFICDHLFTHHRKDNR